MKNIIAHYFIRMRNGKFLIIEGFYIYMLIACAILSFGVLKYYDQWLLIPFLIPFLFGAWMFMFMDGVQYISELKNHWRTQLRLLTDPKMTWTFNSIADKITRERLENRWIETYGIAWEDVKMVKLQNWQPLALPIIAVIIVLIFG